jgi:hypothetical protein
VTSLRLPQAPREALPVRLRRLGAPALFAALALVAAALLAGLLEPYFRTQAAALEADALQAQQQARRLQALAPDAELPAWPARSEREARLQRLLALAEAQNLRLGTLSLDTSDPRAAGPHWQLVRMPLSGDYLALRRLLAMALIEDPALALQSLRLRRTDAGGVEADLVWAFVQQTTAATGGAP